MFRKNSIQPSCHGRTFVKNILFYNNILVNGRFQKEKSVFITMEGVGTRHQEWTREVHNNTYIHVSYDKGITNLLKDIWKLRLDTKNPENSSYKERHDRLVTIIKTYLNNDAYKHVVLTGISHGALIMYKAILQIMYDLDFRTYHTLIKKIKFYPISCPIPLPQYFLRNVDNAGTVVMNYCRIYGKHDFVYNKPVLAALAARVFGAKAGNLFNDACFDAHWENASGPLYNMYDKQRNIIFANLASDPKMKGHTEFEYKFWTPDSPAVLQDPDDAYNMQEQLNLYFESRDVHANTYYGHAVLPYAAQLYLYLPAENILPRGGGGCRTKVKILGRERLIITKGRYQYVRYKGALITLNAAKRLQKEKYPAAI